MTSFCELKLLVKIDYFTGLIVMRLSFLEENTDF